MRRRFPAALVFLSLSSAAAEEKVVHVPTPRPYRQRPGVAPLLKEVRAFIRVGDVRAAPYKLTGQDMTVAVLDTGVRATHVDFGRGARVVQEVNCLSGDKCVEGKGVAADGNGHGTNVAGIIAAGGETVIVDGRPTVVNGVNEGIANHARVVAVKVLDDDGDGTAKSIERGLDWVVKNYKKKEYGITAVNMSLSWMNNLTDDAPYANDPIVKHIRKLRAAGVPVVVAAGNYYATFKAPGMAFPAITAQSISVGAVYDADGGSRSYSNGAVVARSRTAGQVTPFTQRLHPSVAMRAYTDVLAPGSRVLSTGIENDETAISEDEGTSQATPVVAGVILLMQQLLKNSQQKPASVDELETWLRAGPEEQDGDNEDDTLHEPRWNPPYLAYRRVDALASVQALVAARGITLAGVAHAADASVHAADAASSAPPCQGGERAMNLEWSATDRNGFPRNPWFVMQATSATPVDPVVCCGGFPGNKDSGEPVPDRAFGWPRCTNETVLDLPRWLHAATCALEFVRDFRWGVARGHVNWFPVTVRGYGYYDHQSGPDNDVNFEIVPDTLVPPDRVPGQTRWNPKASKVGVVNSLHVEMKKKETLSHFTEPWWKALADEKETEAARKLVSGLRAVAVGLFGVDAEHKGHSELHPAYGLAFRKDCAQSHGVVTETWALFTRNTGNEGWCSRWKDLHHLPLDNGGFVLQLPLDATAKTIAYGSSKLYSNGKDAKVDLVSSSGWTADVLVAAAALTEGSPLRVHGLVTFSWTPDTAGAPVCQAAPPLPPAPPHVAGEEDEGEAFLEELLEDAAYLRGEAGVVSSAGSDDKKDATEVKRDALHLGSFSRKGPCPIDPAGPCSEDVRARTADGFLPESAVATAGLDKTDDADAYLCAAARARHQDTAKAAKGKAVDSPEGLELRNLEAVLYTCDAVGYGDEK